MNDKSHIPAITHKIIFIKRNIGNKVGINIIKNTTIKK